MNYPLQCRCGTLRGYVRDPRMANRGVCYCKDCQAFAHYLNGAATILDEFGGTGIVQSTPANVVLGDGLAALACVRLTANGLTRWYADCCKTPIGNTPANYRISFIGLVHNCLESAGVTLDAAFGPVRMHVNTGSAKAAVRSEPLGLIRGIATAVTMVARARIDGSYKDTPFFGRENGVPIVTPRILSRSEHEELMQRL